MCLDINRKSNVKLANNDIICYKVAYYDERNKLRTYARNSIFKLGKTYTSSLHRITTLNYDYITVELHSFKNNGEAIDVMKALSNHFKKQYVVIKCIIPKGSLYYIGSSDETEKEFASNKLTYVEVL